MTSPISGRYAKQRAVSGGRSAGSRHAFDRSSLLRTADCPPPTAFTLIELLVVIGIIAVLASLVLVAVSRVARSGGTIKAKADLQSIATALEAYKLDFGAYPQVTTPNSGAAVLCKALLGPSPKPRNAAPFEAGEVYQQAYVPPASPPPTYVALAPASGNPPVSPAIESDWMLFNSFDGADGTYPDFREVGFRVGPKVLDDGSNGGTAGDGVPDRPGGKVWGPYVQPDKFKVNKDSIFFVDGTGKPILYFPAATSKPNLTTAGGFVSDGPGGLFNAQDNIRFVMRKAPLGTETNNTDTALKRIRAMFGDYGLDGALNKQIAMETDPGGAEGLPFVLWTAGADGLFGPYAPTDTNPKDALNLTPADATGWKANQRAVQASDDVTNIR